MIAKAAEEARHLRQNWLGPEHLLLAVLAEPSIATEIMADLGVTHDGLAAQFGGMKTVNGRRIRYIESKGVQVNPAAHKVSGWARGFAAASGRERPTPEDWLLSIIYHDPDKVGAAVHGLGISAAAVVDAIRRREVKTPDFAPEEHQPWRGFSITEVARSEWKSVVDLLNEKHPAGSEWRWGFNSRKDRPGKIQFLAEEGIDLEAIVAEARSGQAQA